jgi:hypothetical protein
LLKEIRQEKGQRHLGRLEAFLNTRELLVTERPHEAPSSQAQATAQRGISGSNRPELTSSLLNRSLVYVGHLSGNGLQFLA